MYRTVFKVVLLSYVLGFGTIVALRLPRSVLPVHYHLKFVIQQPQCLFSGTVLTTVKVINSTDTIWMHASKFLTIDESNIYVKRVQNENADINNNEISEAENLVREGENYDSSHLSNVTLIRGTKESKDIIHLDLGGEELEEASFYLVHLAFNGTMNKRRPTGIYCKPYKDNNSTKYLVSASFEPTHARTAFPCWDEPGFKANFTISIAHENKSTAISNMPLKTSQPYTDEEGWVLDTFQTSPPIATFLLSFLVSEYVNTVSKYPVNGKKISVWSRSDINERADFPLRMGSRHLAFLEDYTSIEDPMPKQDFVAIRDFVAGGLENWGIITFEERLLLFDPKYRRNKQVVLTSCNVVAHELAHIWFGNLVTPEWWDDIWLSEGISSYYAALSTARVYPTWNYRSQSWAIVKKAAMSRDSLPTTHPLKLNDVNTFKDVFDEITYHKGHSMIYMLNASLGEKALKDGMRSYLHSNLYGYASHSALWSSLQKAARAEGTLPEDLELETLMEPWVTLPGYPVLSVERDYEKGEFTISQRSILNLGADNEARSSEQGWWIPLSFTYEGDPSPSISPKFWLTPDTLNFTMKDPARPQEWLLFNVHGTGYYRVTYDMRNAGLLLSQLSELSVSDRIQVVSDILEITAVSHQPITISLDVILYFKTETSPFPWFSFLASTPKMATLLRNTEIEELFVDLLREVLAEGMKKTQEDSPHRKEMIATSCKFDVPQCTDMALIMFNKWLKNPNYDIKEDIRHSVYCLGVRKGNETTWNTVLERYKATEDNKHKKELLKALSCTENQKLLERYLSMAMNESNKTLSKEKNSATILKAVSKNNPDILLKALATKKVKPPKTKSGKWQKTLENLALAVNNEEQMRQLRTILNVKSALLKSAPVNNAVLSIAEANINWLERNKNDIAIWLRNREKNN